MRDRNLMQMKHFSVVSFELIIIIANVYSHAVHKKPWTIVHVWVSAGNCRNLFRQEGRPSERGSQEEQNSKNILIKQNHLWYS